MLVIHCRIKLEIRFILVVNPLVFKGCPFLLTFIAHPLVIELDF